MPEKQILHAIMMVSLSFLLLKHLIIIVSLSFPKNCAYNIQNFCCICIMWYWSFNSL